jgi:hypothetical protein
MALGFNELLLTSTNFALVYLGIGVRLSLVFEFQRVFLFDIAVVYSLDDLVEFLVAHVFFAVIAVVVAYFVQAWFGLSSTTWIFTGFSQSFWVLKCGLENR